MTYSPLRLFLKLFSFVLCLSLEGKSLWAMDKDRCENVSPRIQGVDEIIEELERNGQDVTAIENSFEGIRRILSCPTCKGGDNFPYHACQNETSDAEGYSGAKIIKFPNEAKPTHIIKSFEEYELHSISLSEVKKPLKNSVYLEKCDHQLKYKLLKLKPNEEIVEGTLDIPVDGDLTHDSLIALKPKILTKISEEGHIEEVGLKDFVYSLMAFHMHKNCGLDNELKMVSICDAFICPGTLKFVMENAEGADIHSFMNNMNARDNVIIACAEYLGTFHVRYLMHQTKVEEGQGSKFLSRVAKEFYHKLCAKRIQSLQGQKGSELFKLEIGKQIESINIKDFKSDEIIQILKQADQEDCINFIKRTQKLFEKCSGYVYRALNPCGEGTKRLYWTTITHGDAHRRNFFYNNLGLDVSPPEVDPDSLERVTMIDYSSIMDTWGNIGDPAQDVGRFLGSLWDWASEEKSQEGLYSVIHGLQKTFLECYKETVKASLNISDDFENIFIENCNFYKLRYYRTIFNSFKERKSPKSKMQLLQYWMSEMQSHITGPSAEFANNLLKEKKYYRESKGSKERKWVGAIEATKQVIHNLPEKLTVFIESTPKTSEKSHLTRLWEQLHNGSGVATLLQEGDDVPIADMVGIGKTSLALEYAYEGFEHRAYNLIWWLCSEQPEISLKQGYEDILVKVEEVSEPSKDWKDLKQLYEDIFFKTKELYNTSSDWSQENQKKEEYSVKRLKAIIESYVESHKCKWLLIYDNARDLVKLKELIPQHKNIHVLVTSRNQEGCEDPFCLKVFSPEESVKYLLAETGADTENPDNKETAQEVAKTLGYLPLALSEAANYVKLIGGEAANSTHFRKYLENPATNPMTDPENRCERFVHTLHQELSKGSEVGQHAIDIMVLCAYLNPDLISENIFLGTALDQGKTKKALNKLYDASYLSTKEGGYSIHCLLQKSTLHELGTSDKLCNVSKRIETLFYQYVSDESDILDVLTFLPHVFTLLEHLNSEINPPEEIKSLQWIGRILCNWYNHPYQYACDLFRQKKTGKFEGILPQAVVNGKQELLIANPEVYIDPDSCMNIINLHPKIYNALGLIYAYGKYGLNKDSDKAMKYLKESDDKEDINAPLYIGKIYEIGLVNVEEKDNISQKNTPQIQSDISQEECLQVDNPQYKGAMEKYQKANGRGNSLANLFIGKIYECEALQKIKKSRTSKKSNTDDWQPIKEDGSKQYKEAMKYYQKATGEKNCVAVTHAAWAHIGTLYENGLGVKKDYSEAMNCYKKTGDASALVSLGKKCIKNECAKSYEIAMTCYNSALELDKHNYEAMTEIGWLYQNKHVNSKHDNINAMDYYQRAAVLKCPWATYYIAYLYQKGWTKNKKQEPNYETALAYYMKAAELGNMKAINNIKEIGEIYKKDSTLSKEQRTKKAENCLEIANKYEEKGKS